MCPEEKLTELKTTKSTDPLDLTEYSGIPKTMMVIGTSCTGKTTFLLDKVLESLQNGVEPDDVVVICASALNAQDFKLSMQRRLANNTTLPRILTVREIALEILADPAAIAQTGRYPRLLADFEINFLLEDLKVSGIKPHRIKEMTKFFYRSWTELLDECPEWLLTIEEKNLHLLLKNELIYLRAMLEPELANTALKLLRANSGIASKWHFSQIFVDDYQLISRASQLLVHLLAQDCLTISGDEETTLEVFESYPYAAGLEEFVLINPEAELVKLTEVFQSKNTSVKPFVTPLDEFDGVSKLVSSLLATGCKPGDMAIAVFHRTWAQRIKADLGKLGVSAEVLYQDMSLSGDIRCFDKSKALMVYTALRLVADPHDDFSWRCWCGFGDYLANSLLFANIKEYVGTQMPLSEVNEELRLYSLLQSMESSDDCPVKDCETLLPLYQAGRTLIDSCRGLTGAEALEKIVNLISGNNEEALPHALRIPGWDNQELSVTELVRLFEQYQFAPQLADPTNSVLIASPAWLSGKHVTNLIISGFVNGFIPSRDYFDGTITTIEKQARIQDRDRRTISLLLGCAQKNLTVTYFERIDPVSAERLKLSIKRIRIEKGEKTCVISPSQLLDLITITPE